MGYTLRIFTADDVQPHEREQALQRFRNALNDSLGHESMVLPVYHAHLKLSETYLDHPRPWPISEAEQLLAERWEAAELAATQAAFGTDRYMGDAEFELGSSNTPP